MVRPLALLLLGATAALAQGFNSLATNRDGSVLYFSSPARMRSTNQYLHPKIFRWNAAKGVTLFAQRRNDLVPTDMVIPGLTGKYSLSAPDTSDDGSVVSFVGTSICWGFSGCLSSSLTTQTTIYAPGHATDNPITLPGAAALSPNGRYAAVATVVGAFPGASLAAVDLQTSRSTPYNAAAIRSARRRWAANDGTIIVGARDGITLVNTSQTTTVPNSSDGYFAMVNDATSLVVFEGPGTLSVYSLHDGTTRDLATGPAASNWPALSQFGASMSYDGARIAFLKAPDEQVYVIGSDGTGLRQLTHFSQPVTEAALSGDGTVMFAVTADNSLVRIDVATGDSVELIPATPYVGSLLSSLCRGCLGAAAAHGYSAQSQQAAVPYPSVLAGVEVRIQGTPVPVAAVAPEGIRYAVPWDLPGSYSALLDVEIRTDASASPFTAGFEADLGRPYFASRSVIHEDFSSLVTAADPAKPGEIVHLYAYDLGIVNPLPFPGTPTSGQPLFFLAEPMSCYLADRQNEIFTPLDTEFAGLAPDLLYVFQVNLRLPRQFTAPLGTIGCTVGDPKTAGSYLTDVGGPQVWLSGGGIVI